MDVVDPWSTVHVLDIVVFRHYEGTVYTVCVQHFYNKTEFDIPAMVGVTYEKVVL